MTPERKAMTVRRDEMVGLLPLVPPGTPLELHHGVVGAPKSPPSDPDSSFQMYWMSMLLAPVNDVILS